MNEVYLLKSKNRRIIIENQTFICNYTDEYNRTDDSYNSRLFFSPEGNKDMGVECFFKSHAHFFMGCHLNVGFLAIKDGKESEINFNQPGFVSEFIKFMLTNKVDFTKQKRYVFDNAWDFLKEMGYDSFRTPYVFYPKE